MQADRVLRPLDEAGPSIEQLDRYESPAALTAALRATWHGVERTLRMLLREDVTAPDELRLTVMSSDLVKFDALMSTLRARDMISLDLAGRIFDVGQSVQRAGQGEVHAADADRARELVERLRVEVRRYATSRTPAAVAALPDAEAGDVPDEASVYEQRDRRVGRRSLVLGSIAATILVGTVLLLHFTAGSSPMEAGITAFRAERMGDAERHFRAALNEDRTSVTAMLYLARVLRDQQRNDEAADLLRNAAARAPRDPAVRRELGYLFMDLRAFEPAAKQFEQAVELEPAEALNWVGLVEALTLAGDPRATEMQNRAPAEAQELLRTRRR